MNYRVRRHEKVEDDILDLAAWIARDSRLMAFGFLEAVESTLSDLRSMPNKGSPKNLGASALRKSAFLGGSRVSKSPNSL